jgi:hypothetical protein
VTGAYGHVVALVYGFGSPRILIHMHMCNVQGHHRSKLVVYTTEDVLVVVVRSSAKGVYGWGNLGRWWPCHEHIYMHMASMHGHGVHMIVWA